MADEFSLNAEMTLDTSGFINGLEQAQNAMSGFQSGMSDMSESMEGMEQSEEQGGKGLEGWGISLDTFTSKGSSLLKSFGLDVDVLAAKFGMSSPLLAGIIAATLALEKLGQAMDEATSEIVKGTGATGAALDSLEQSMRTALQNGVTLPAQQVAGVIADLNTKFGITGKELTDMTEDFDQFARITGTDARQAVDTVGDAIKKWGVETKSTKAVLNQLTKASQDSGLSVDKLASSLKSSQAIFSQFGMNLTESTAFLANLKKAGLESDTVLTSMRTGLAKFAVEGKEPKEAMKELSEQIKNASSETEALSLATEAFGSKGGAEMVKVFRSGAFDVEEYAESLNHVGNAMRDTDEASRTVQDAMAEMKNSFMGTFGQFGQIISGLFKNIIDIARNIMTVFSPVIDSIGGAFRKLIGGFGNTVSKIVFYISDLVKRVNVQGTVISKVLNAIGNVFSKVFSAIGGIAKWLHHTLAIIINKIKILLLQSEKKLAPILQPILEKVTSFVNGILNGINSFLSKLRELAKKIGAEDLIPDNINLLVVEPLDNRIDTINKQILELTKENQDLTKDLKSKADSTVEYASSAYQTQEEILDQEGTFAGNVAGQVGDAVEKFADLAKWEDKILSQTLSVLETEKANDLQRAKNRGATEEELLAIEKDYNDKILALKEEQIERERKRELESIKGTENEADAKLKINQYYDKEIERLHGETVAAIKLQDDDRYKLEEEWNQKLLSQKNELYDYEEKALKSLAKTEQEKELIAYDYAKKRYEMEMESLKNQRETALAQAGNVKELLDKINEYYDAQEMMATGNMNMETMRHNKTMENLNAEADAETDADADRVKRFKKIMEWLGRIKNTISGTVKVIGKVMSAAVKLVSKSAKAIKNIFLKLIEFDNDEMLNSLLAWEDKVLTFFTEGASQIPAFVASALQSVSVLTDNIMNMISGEGIQKALENIIQSIVKEVPKIISNIANILLTIISALVDVLKNNMGNIVQAIATVVKKIVKMIPKMLPVIIDGIISIVEGLIDALVEIVDDDETMDALVNAIVEAIQKVTESILKNLPKIIKVVVKVIVAIVKVIVKSIASIIRDTDWRAVWEEFKRVGGELLGGIWDGIKSGFSYLWGKIKDFFATIGEWIKNFFDELWQKIKDAIMGVVDEVKSIPEKIGGGVSGFFENVGSGIKSGISKIGSGIKSFFGFAEGTDNAPAGVALVGEEGPELVRFHGGEQVVPAPQTRQILGGGNSGSVFNVTFNNTQDTTAFAMMKQMKGWQRSLAFNAVI